MPREFRRVAERRGDQPVAQAGAQRGETRPVMGKAARPRHVVAALPATSSDKAQVVRMLSPTRPVKRSPRRLTTGTPVHKASAVVVPPQ